MSARLVGAVLALAFTLATAASAVRVGGEFPVAPETAPELLDLPAPGMHEPQSPLTRMIERARELIDEGQLLLASGVLERAVAEAPDAEDLRLTLAQLYTRLGRSDDALRIAEAARAADPKAAAPNAVLGSVYKQRGQVDQAVAAFERWVELSPKDATAHERLGDALHQRDSKAALAHYQRAIALEPKRVTALARSAVVLVELDRAEEGVRLAERALSLDEDDSLALLTLGYAHRAMGQRELAEQDYRRGISRAPDHAPFTLRLAEILRETGRVAPAIEALKALLARVPDAHGARTQLADLYGEAGDSAHRELELGRMSLARGERAQAESRFRAALAADAQLDDVLLELAVLEVASADLDAAAAHLVKLSEAARSSARAELLRGHIALARKDTDGAEAAYRRASVADPADAAGSIALARLFAHSRRCGEAVKLYADAIARGAGLPSVHSERAACHVEQGQLALAETSFRAALIEDPQHLDALSGLAWVYLRSEKNPDLAGFLAERALALRPDDPQLHYMLGRARLATGRRAEAARQFELALDKEPDRPEWLHQLGAVRFALGESDEARRRLERVLEVAPAYPQAAAVRALLEQIAAGPGT